MTLPQPLASFSRPVRLHVNLPDVKFSDIVCVSDRQAPVSLNAREVNLCSDADEDHRMLRCTLVRDV